MHPKGLCPIIIDGDGNCLPKSLSHCYSGSDSMHLEIRARIVVHGLANKEYYTCQEYLSRGATNAREGKIPYTYVEYSDYYVNGQRITNNTLDYIYTRELHDCAKVGSYMGLWQLAQASTVLNIPIQSVFPDGTDQIMRQDFNRYFFPATSTNCNASESDKLVIMWTSTQLNCTPNHFIPLIKKKDKVCI